MMMFEDHTTVPILRLFLCRRAQSCGFRPVAKQKFIFAENFSQALMNSKECFEGYLDKTSNSPTYAFLVDEFDTTVAKLKLSNFGVVVESRV